MRARCQGDINIRLRRGLAHLFERFARVAGAGQRVII